MSAFQDEYGWLIVFFVGLLAPRPTGEMLFPGPLAFCLHQKYISGTRCGGLQMFCWDVCFPLRPREICLNQTAALMI